MGNLRQHYVGMVCAVVCGIFNHLFTIAVSALCAYMVSLALEQHLMQSWKPLFLSLGVLILLRVISYFAEMWFAHDVAFKVLADLRILLLEAVERVSPAILLNRRSGQLASTLMSDVELLEWFFAHSFGSVFVAGSVSVTLLIFLGWLHPILPIIMLAFLAVLVIIPFLMKKKADEQGANVRKELGDANSVTVEGLQGMKEILMLNNVEAYQDKNRRYMEKMYVSQYHYGRRLGTEGALLQLTVGLSSLCMLGVTAVLVFKGQLAFTYYPVVMMVAGLAFNPVLELCNTARNFGLIFAAASRVFQVIDAKPLVEDKGTPVDTSKLESSVTFEQVSFRYREELEPAVKDISFTVKPGQRVALVGHSGSGKSTCVSLLLRYWDPESGAIRIGQRDIRQMTMDNLRELISVVLQDVYLFNVSIKENIRLGRVDATDEEVEKAAKTAMAHEFIVELPEGYDTVAGERGLSLSGGQRQRIAIARAILKGSPILVLDEAVSSLDSENEAEIQRTIERAYSGFTTLIVAHRISTIMSADLLVVLDKGCIAGIGTHEELFNTNKIYRELVLPQICVKGTEG
ncbi:ABC transporter ATP-binding protein [Aminipila butyrica]|uniref:ABC transporter ATP-binding protein n=2 Tax=Aminipila butyrica TaxID=433296 RepID=A0A858BYJ5_9FIRM|nr:ABC transporter ATP-binding protein [Aminipila butyrica]